MGRYVAAVALLGSLLLAGCGGLTEPPKPQAASAQAWVAVSDIPDGKLAISEGQVAVIQRLDSIIVLLNHIRW